MNLNAYGHKDLIGKHALFSASKYDWTRWKREDAAERIKNRMAAARGTMIHDWAAKSINLGMRIPGRNTNNGLYQYINDAIRFGMTPELLLYANPLCFGTSDSVSFNENKGRLRIHDLKTGKTGSMQQLLVYDAFFCIEYGNKLNFKPGDIEIINRLYWPDHVDEFAPSTPEVVQIIDQIEFIEEFAKHAYEEAAFNEQIFDD